MSVRDPYYTDFAREYDRHNSGVSGDVEFYRELAQQAGGPVVELGVGTGRVAIPVVQAGVAVLGLDLSPEMLVICREKAREARATALALAIGDMRRFALTRPAALLTIPHRAFLHNLTTDDQLATLACCRAALPRGGRLALNVFNPDLGQITDWTERGPGRVGRRAGVAVRREATSRLRSRIAARRLDGDAPRRGGAPPPGGDQAALGLPLRNGAPAGAQRLRSRGSVRRLRRTPAGATVDGNGVGSEGDLTVTVQCRGSGA